MLNKTAALLMLSAAFSAPAWADWDFDRGYGRVIRVEPAVSVGFRDGRNHFQILYEFGGERYWTYADTYPGPWIAIPEPRYVYTVPAPRYVYRYRWDNYYYPNHWGDGHRHDRWDRDHRHHDDRDGDHRGRRFERN